MIQKQASRKNVKVTFVVPVDSLVDGGEISVVGQFNDWDHSATPLTKRGKTYKASVTLPPGGRYAFRYRTGEGEWFNDDDADDYEPNEFGGHNCVIDLTEPLA